jgi:NitT/TauT family transport system substrate-binding protein
MAADAHPPDHPSPRNASREEDPVIQAPHSRRAAMLASAVVVGALVAAPAAAQDPSGLAVPTVPETPTSLEFLYSPFTDYAPFFVAEDKGYFDANGLDVTLSIKAGSAETSQLLATGQSQSGGDTWAAPFFNSVAQGATIAVVAQLAKVPEDPALKSPVPLIVSKARFDSGELTSVADLAPAEDGTKKKIGIPGPGGFGEYSVFLALQTAGLTMADIEQVYLGPPDALPALESGAIDAAWTIEPFPTIWGDAVASISDDHARGVELGFVAMNRDWLEANEDAAILFTAAYIKASRELDAGGFSDPAIKDIVAKYTELPIETLDAIGKTIRSEDGSFDEASVRAQEEYFRQADQLTYEGEADLSSVVRTDILHAANAFLAANP